MSTATAPHAATAAGAASATAGSTASGGAATTTAVASPPAAAAQQAGPGNARTPRGRGSGRSHARPPGAAALAAPGTTRSVYASSK